MSNRFVHVKGKALGLPDAGAGFVCDKDVPWYRRVSKAVKDIDWGAPGRDHGSAVYCERLAALRAAAAAAAAEKAAAAKAAAEAAEAAADKAAVEVAEVAAAKAAAEKAAAEEAAPAAAP